MKKNIKDFTPEIKAKIPQYIEKYTQGVFDGKRFETFKFENAEKLINWNYEQCNFKKPVVLVASNPFEAQILFNYIKKNKEIFTPILYILYCIKNEIELPKELTEIKTKNSQLYNQLYSQLYNQLRSQLDSQLDNQLNSQLYSQLDNQLSDQLSDQLNSQLRSQLYSQLRSQLSDQLYSQLYNQLNSQLSDQLYSQLYNQLYSQLDSQLSDQLSDQLNRQLNSQLYSQLRSQLSDQLYSQLYNQLNSQLSDQLYSQLDNQLYNQLRSQLSDQLDSQLNRQLDNQLYRQLYSQLRSQLIEYNNDYLFTSNVYSGSYGAWFKFIKDEFNLESEIGVTLDSWNELYQNSGIYSAIFSELVCVISKYPKKVYRNSNNDMHNLNGVSVEWDNLTDITGFECYYINGRNLSKKYFESISNKTFTMEDFINESNEEYKSTCIAFMQEKHGEEYLVQFFRQNLQEVNTFVDKKDEEYLKGTIGGMNIGVYTLFKGEINNEKIAYVRCYCPSTDRMFFLGVDEIHNTAKDAIASLYRIPSKLKSHIKSISRQGERFSTILTDEGKKVLKSMSEEEISDNSTLKGAEYFDKIKYEF